MPHLLPLRPAMASSGETVHTQLAAVAESVNSNSPSAVADAGDPVVVVCVVVVLFVASNDRVLPTRPRLLRRLRHDFVVFVVIVGAFVFGFFVVIPSSSPWSSSRGRHPVAVSASSNDGTAR